MGRRIWKSKKLIITALLFAIGVGVFVFALHGISVYALDIGQALQTAIGTVLESTINLLTRGIGALMFKMVGLLVLVGNYSDFINAPAVTKGWILARDVMNMFFVIVLLVIAIATILQKKELAYQAMLPRLIITALVINFSKTICGLLIDASQIFMLTFFGAIASASGANFAVLAGIPSVFSKGANSACGVHAVAGAVGDIFTSLFAFIFALVMIVIATIVIAALLIMLVVRIVTLWFLVILSPVAFFFIGLKQIDTQGIGKTWTTEFMKQIFFGPAGGFFLWLSLAVTQDQVGSETDVRKVNMTGALGPTFKAKIGGLSISTGLDANCGETGAMGTGGIMSMLVGMGLLIGTLVVAGQCSNKAGSAVSGFAMGVIKGDKMKFTPWAMGKQMAQKQMGRTSEFLQSKQNLALGKAINYGRKKMGMQPIQTRAAADHADYEAKKKEEQTSISKKSGRFNELTTSEREDKAQKVAGIQDAASIRTQLAAARAAGNSKEEERLTKELDTAEKNDPRVIMNALEAARAAGNVGEVDRLTKVLEDFRKTKPQNGQDLATLVEMMLKNKELDATNVNHREMVNKVLQYRQADPKGLQSFNDELLTNNPSMYLETTLGDLSSTDATKQQRAHEKFVELEKLGKIDAAKVRGKMTADDTRIAFQSPTTSDEKKLKLLQTMVERGEVVATDLPEIKRFDEMMKTNGMVDTRKAFRENLQKTNSKLYFDVAYVTSETPVPDMDPATGLQRVDAAGVPLTKMRKNINHAQLLNDYKAGKYDPATMTKDQADSIENDPAFMTAVQSLLDEKQRDQFLGKAHEANEFNLTATISSTYQADIAAARTAGDTQRANQLTAKLIKMQKSMVVNVVDPATGRSTPELVLPKDAAGNVDVNVIDDLMRNKLIKMEDLARMNLTGVPQGQIDALFGKFAADLSENQFAQLAEANKGMTQNIVTWMEAQTPRVAGVGGVIPPNPHATKLGKLNRAKGMGNINFI